MSDPQSKTEISDELQQVGKAVSETARRIPAAQLDQGTAEAWSACDYLKHLLLSVKPLAKAMNLPPAKLKGLFGEPDHPSRNYADLVAKYQARLDDGIRAEDYGAVTPVSFRMPDDVADVQEYLVKTWDEATERLIGGLAQWSEADLDGHQLLHPAMGAITVREMLFFTIYHNTMHWHDIQHVGGV